MFEYYLDSEGRRSGDVFPSIKWSLAKLGTLDSWAADKVPLQWEKEHIINIPPAAHLKVPLAVVPMRDSCHTDIFRYGNMKWSTGDRDRSKLPHCDIS